MHNGMSHAVKIFRKFELWFSMARLTSNLVKASQIKRKKWKKDLEIGEIRTPNQPQMTKKQHFLLIENLNLLDISKIGTFRDLYLIPCGRS